MQDAGCRMQVSKFLILIMKLLLLVILPFWFSSCFTQRSGVLKGKVDIGPLCPQEPCNPTPERLKQIYDAYQVVVLDTTGTKILFRIAIQQDASFNKKISVGEYVALIRPVAGSGFRNEPKRISIQKGKTTDLALSYDTGLR
jgi:hypothetical protein